ncbi:MAG: cytochrome-c peroxidase, cytochrome c peroxidase [Candidatus Dadabacteria bacterium CSP1-2]|jgi:cytochrome c peroxidase|nr:MAG: cytochrome-c peroxidase, cytochrome c peroxidase [Candidatus Dadabacteria bacterium CSP1-2]
MRIKILLSLSIVIILVIIMGAAWAQDELLNKAQTLFKPIPETLPTLKDNPLTPEKIKLGKMLYFDPRLSASNLISCNTCHNLATGGVDLQETSIGHGWQKGPRNAPTVLNSVFNIAQFWDGRAKDLAEQAGGPMQASVEMDNTPERVVAVLKSMPQYVELFKKSFSNEKDPVTFNYTTKAIEAFEATLLTPNSRFDQFLKGNTSALNAKEKEGLKLFMDKGCTTCHNGIDIGGGMFQKFGLVKSPDPAIRPPEDKGRFKVTNSAGDEFVFKVPTLRNIELTRPYFHSGKVWTLQETVRIMASVQLGIPVTDDEVDKITAFLRTLTGEQPKIEYPILPPDTDNTPRPILEILGKGSEKH